MYHLSENSISSNSQYMKLIFFFIILIYTIWLQNQRSFWISIYIGHRSVHADNILHNSLCIYDPDGIWWCSKTIGIKLGKQEVAFKY